MGRTKLHDVQEKLKKTKDQLKALQRAKDGCRIALSEALPLGDHITILSVGPQLESIYLHTNLLPPQTKAWIATHPLINNLLYRLPQEEADMLRRCRLFLYTGKIASKDEDPSEAGDTEWHQLVLMYVFSRKCGDEKFANTVINALVEKVEAESRWPTDLAGDVYEATRVGDALRRVYVDLHVWVGRGSGIREAYEDRNGPWAFIHDVQTALYIAGAKITDAEVEVPWVRDLCGYHKHEVTPVCGRQEVEVVDLTEV